MVFRALFGKMDDVGVIGLLPIWLSFFFTSFGVMLGDDSVGAPRNFCAVSQIICCANLCTMAYSVTNNVPLSKANVLTFLLDMMVTWTAFAYFGGSDVFSSSAIGIFNYIQVPIQALMTLVGLTGMIAIARDPNGYQQYLEERNNREGPNTVVPNTDATDATDA